MARRATVIVALASVVALLPASAAVAEVHSTSFVAPGAGAVLSEPTPMKVAVEWQFERPRHVEVRLVDSAGKVVDGTEPVRLTDCSGNCDRSDLRRRSAEFSGASLDPASLAPFRPDARQCNGAYGLQARPEGEGWGTGMGFVVSAAPSAPTDVEVDPGTARVTIDWSPAPEPDVVGYTVHRREGSSGSWQTVAEVGQDATSATDREAPAGRVEYRVTTFRGDGLDDEGDALAACRDEDPDLHAAAAPVATTVVAASTDPTEGGSSPSPGRSSPGDGASTDPDREGGSTTEDDDGTDGGERSTEDDDGEAASPDPSPNRRAPSPSVENDDARPDVSVPQVEGPSTPSGTDEESFYGEDEEFSEELDFGDLGSAQAGDDVEGSVALDVPGGMQGVLGERLVLDRVLKPVAGGMILLAFALHLRRWVRETVD